MNKLPLIILGSARKTGDTHKLVEQLFNGKEYDQLDLLDYKIHPYTYTGEYPADDQFLDVVQEMLSHDVLLFATPVYWYAMSGIMKTVFDRLTDIVTINKHHGRQMMGKKTFLLATGSDEGLPTGFEEPFALTSAYLEMIYSGCYYCSIKKMQVMPDKTLFLQQVYS